MYSEITEDIRITVEPSYLEKQSDPDENHYVWAYQIRIENLGGRRVQLRNRFWSITDAMGRTQVVQGPGVVGEQPLLDPGASFQYTSGCPLSTPSGIMVGHYEMEGPGGEMFEVRIPAFSLDSPFQPNRLN
jgi:ApaG protein